MRRRKRDNNYKINLFMSYFTGLKTAYGSYDPKTGKYFVQKQPVTKSVIYHHLKGEKPYGFYLLTGTRTNVGVIDFDEPDFDKPQQLHQFARECDFPVYIERSKSKGHHVWMFFEEQGVEAQNVRILLTWMLSQIAEDTIEVFPKQDEIDPSKEFGNFINAPLFGKLVSEGKTVFVNPASMEPLEDQWRVLESMKRVSGRQIEEFINAEITEEELELNHNTRPNTKRETIGRKYPLPTCIRRMLAEGVTFDQRVACFRIAVQLMQIGLPFDHALAVLREWRTRNRPHDGKRIITDEEVYEQTTSAYKKNYKSYGCNEPVTKSFCDPDCPLLWNRNNKRY